MADRSDLFNSDYQFYKKSKLDAYSPPSFLRFRNDFSSAEISEEILKESHTPQKYCIQCIEDLSFVEKEIDKHLLLSLKEKMLEILEIKKTNGKYPNNKLSKLPGPLPVTLSRKNLPLLRSENYWISEKSDGERCMIYITEKSSFLVTRSFDFFAIKDTFYSKYLWSSGNSILDGEIIFRPSSTKVRTNSDPYLFLKNKPVLLIFDIVQLQGKSVHKYRLTDRFAAIRTFNCLYRKFANEKKHPLALMAKTFFRAKEIESLCKMISRKEGEDETRVFMDRKKGFANGNDGLIFTPEKTEFLQPLRTLFKWKYPEMNSFDFCVYRPFFSKKRKRHLDLHCAGNGNKTIFCTTIGPFSDQPRAVLLEQLQASEHDFCVVECAIAANRMGKKVWKILKVRADRNSANHVSTIIRTMEIGIESISLREIKSFLN